jgi:hypothetical protein
MKPKSYSVALDISPKVVISKMNHHKRLEVPDDF